MIKLHKQIFCIKKMKGEKLIELEEEASFQ